MKAFVRLVLVLPAIVLLHNPAFSFQAVEVTDNAKRAEAERLWKLMIQAKGGRERLHSVSNLQRSEHEKYWWWCQIITINYEGLFVFPDESWEWDDQRGTDFGFNVEYNLQIFEQIPSRDAGMYEWKRK